MRGAPIQYSAEQLAFIELNKVIARRELTELVNKTFGTHYSTDNIKSLCTRNKWNTGRTGCFEKGHTPSPLARPKGPNKTSFKKGDKPVNHRKIGSERTNVDGYIEIKVAEGKFSWRLKQRVVWEQHNGKLLANEVIRFKDGDKLNCNDINNLEKFNRQENVRLNQMRVNDLPDEIKPVIKTMVRVLAAASKLEKANQTTQAGSGANNTGH